jgi:hypothetical protein
MAVWRQRHPKILEFIIQLIVSINRLKIRYFVSI